MTTPSKLPKHLPVRAGRIGLPYPGTTDPEALLWVREDEIRHIERVGQGCVITFAAPARSVETSDNQVMNFYEKSIGATVDEVLSACERAMQLVANHKTGR